MVLGMTGITRHWHLIAVVAVLVGVYMWHQSQGAPIPGNRSKS
jgi:hypothetical protein